MKPVAAKVTRGKQPIAYFTPVKRKQILWVRIELKSPIGSRNPPFTPQEMEVGKREDKLEERPLVSGCKVRVCKCVLCKCSACLQIDSKLGSEYLLFGSMSIDP